MRKTVTVIIFVIIIFTISTAFAASPVIPSKTKAEPGDSVTISGTANPDSSIIIKITDEKGNIVFIDAVKTDASGAYSVTFAVPCDITAKTLDVTAGSGTDIATAVLTVVYPATPTATSQPTATPTASSKPTTTPTASAKPTTTPTASPKPTGTPTASPKPITTPMGSPKPAAMPSPSPTVGHTVVIEPVTVKRDEVTGKIIIGIAVSDLPEGTNAVQTPDGKTFYVKDAVDGVLWIEVAQNDIGDSGEIEIVAIGENQMPLATVRMQVQGIPKTGDGAPVILWWAIGGAAVLLVALLIILLAAAKKRQKTQANNN